MSVPPIQLAALDWAAAAAGTMARPWPVGSVVSGRVLELQEGTRLILQINGLKVETEQPFDVLVPHNFQARVLSAGAQPILELLGSPGKASPAAAALRARLPSQGGLQPLLADLRALAGAPTARLLPEPVRTALARLEASITDRHDILDPDVLRDTVQRAGAQLEHELVEQAGASSRMPATRIDYDFKASLQRLSQALRQLPQAQPAAEANADAPPPVSTAATSSAQPRLPVAAADDVLALAAMRQATRPQSLPAKGFSAQMAEFEAALPTAAVPRSSAGAEAQPPLLDLPLQPQARLPVPVAGDALTLATGMLKHVQAAISRIEIMQIEAHPSAMPQACMLEVPIRNDDGFDVLQVRIEADADADLAPDAPASRWTLGFTIDPPSLGAVHGRIRLRGDQVDVDLWAERDAAVAALEQQTAVLPRLLEGSGLELGQLRVRHGTPMRHTGLARRLIEARA